MITYGTQNITDINTRKEDIHSHVYFGTGF